jgi:hypothetical protein
VDCLQKAEKPVLSLEHALHVVEIIDKAERSAAEGRALELEEGVRCSDGSDRSDQSD